MSLIGYVIGAFFGQSVSSDRFRGPDAARPARRLRLEED